MSGFRKIYVPGRASCLLPPSTVVQASQPAMPSVCYAQTSLTHPRANPQAAAQPDVAVEAGKLGAAGSLSNSSSRANALAGRAASGSSSGGGGGQAMPAAGAVQGMRPPPSAQQPPATGAVPGAKRERKDASVRRSVIKRCRDSEQFKDNQCSACKHPYWHKVCKEQRQYYQGAGRCCISVSARLVMPFRPNQVV